MTLIDLRDLRLARAEYEVGHEIVMRLPTARLNISRLQKAAVEKVKERILDEESTAPTNPRQTVQSNPKVPNSR